MTTPQQTAAAMLREAANMPGDRKARAARMAAATISGRAIEAAARAAPWREPGGTLRSAVMRLEAALAEVRANARAARDRMRATWHSGSISGARPLSPARHVRSGTLKTYRGTPAERLEKARRAAVKYAFAHVAAGRTFTAEPVFVAHGVSVSYPYAGHAEKYPRKHHGYTVTVPRHWRRTVEARSLAVVDGLMTLEATLLESPPDLEVFAATWCSIKRDGSPVIGRGYIARLAGSAWWRSYHGATYEGAIAGLRRKLGIRAPAEPDTAETLAKRFRRWLAYPVQVRHAHEVGACMPGIAAWCERVGLDLAAGSAPLADIIAAYGRDPMPEARATILRAVKEARAQAKGA